MDHDGRPERVFGEASFAAPKWGDIHWKESALTVRRSIWHTKALWSEKDPKPHQVRRLVLGEYAMPVLTDRWERF